MTTKNAEKRTSIKLKQSTIDKLKDYGEFQETYDELICRLIFQKTTGKQPDDKTNERIARAL